MRRLLPADIEAMVGPGVYLYTAREMHEKIQREQRACLCLDDDKIFSQHRTDASVSWEAFVFRRKINEGLGPYGIYVRGERDCGMVQFWPEEWIMHPTSSYFWGNLYRRAEKQCQSLDRAEMDRLQTPKNTKQKERQRGSSGWRKGIR